MALLCRLGVVGDDSAFGIWNPAGLYHRRAVLRCIMHMESVWDTVFYIWVSTDFVYCANDAALHLDTPLCPFRCMVLCLSNNISFVNILCS